MLLAHAMERREEWGARVALRGGADSDRKSLVLASWVRRQRPSAVGSGGTARRRSPTHGAGIIAEGGSPKSEAARRGFSRWRLAGSQAAAHSACGMRRSRRRGISPWTWAAERQGDSSSGGGDEVFQRVANWWLGPGFKGCSRWRRPRRRGTVRQRSQDAVAQRGGRDGNNEAGSTQRRPRAR
ncbi:pollen-specific leucine-rich repeat extensin-like protein 4 [Iris pallida]|uniref:Pollen-specific leucine-rich repeat extensin-like protein 4 n=1 Tax=Iris pallida TaxID=29817 RepID=A0AAX6E4H0_IRIPA|nr:pollen-specific leucine-rich repeat extensin-like protein 4 [Iris pallida]